jgi:hypothetical protein
MAIHYLAAHKTNTPKKEFKSLPGCQPSHEDKTYLPIEWDVVFDYQEVIALGEMGLLEVAPSIARTLDRGASKAIAAGTQLLFDKLQ